MQKQHVSLNRLVEDQLESFRQIIGEKVTVNFMSEEGLKDVYANPAYLGQVLTFLFSNTSSALPNGGELIILTRNVASNHEIPQPASTGTGDNNVMLSVTYIGNGMDNSSIARVFEPSSASDGHEAVMGRELSVVKEIVEECDGRMKVRSKSGEGTTFEIYFPSSEGKSCHPGQVIYRRARVLDSSLISPRVEIYQSA